MILWGISERDSSLHSVDNAPLPVVTKLVHFNALNADTYASALLSLRQTGPTTAFLLHSNDGHDKVSVLWRVCEGEREVEVQVQEEGAPVGESSGEAPASEAAAAASNQDPEGGRKDATISAPAAHTNAGAETQGEGESESESKLQARAHPPAKSEPAASEYTVFHDSYPAKEHGKCLFLQEQRELRHDHEVNAVEICQDESGLVNALYFGTTVGPIYKYPCSFR